MRCEVCGKEIEESRYSNAILCSPQCHDDYFWISKIDGYNSGRYFAYRGNLYAIEDENSQSAFRGYDGRHFIITYDDDTTVHTTNLWFCGSIPAKFRQTFVDSVKKVEELW